MSIVDSIVVSIFSLSLVFIVLTFLIVLIKVLSFALGVVHEKQTKVTNVSQTVAPTQPTAPLDSADIAMTAFGELRLYDVDEKTAALIMAIVSDESKIPVDELCFKSIKAIDESAN